MRPTILYVDDDVGNLAVFEAAFADEFEVVTVTSGDEALSVMRSREVGVLLTDQRMPGMSGVDLAEAVRTEFPDTIRLLITAYTDLSAAIDAINRGRVRRYLKKPWDAAELRATLGESLDLYEMTRRVKDLERRLVETERVYSLGVVTAGIAHELRNPLSWVTANLSLVADGLVAMVKDVGAHHLDVGSLAARLRELLEAVDDARDGAKRITDIARGIELSTRSHADDDLVDLRDVVALTAKMVYGESRKKVAIDLELAEVPALRGSRTKIGQVVLNLLVNALQAVSETGRADGRIKVSLTARDGDVALTIADNGPGIAPDTLGRIFDPFFTTKREGGTGLGLAISRRIVEEHGGRIDLASTLGSGATFTIVLPTAPEKAPSTQR